jgi:DNA processing protein
MQTSTDLIHRVVCLARSRKDGWIPVDQAVESCLNRGADLTEIADTISAGILPEPSILPTGVTIADATSQTYPWRLARVSGRPLLLYIRGNLPTPTAVPLAIVGSRKPTPEAETAAFTLARDLAAAGHPIVSGLAEGIDTAAHRGALSSGGETIAVLGTGIDRVFPAQNLDLSRLIGARGALVSQFAPGQGPTKSSFPARNAVIAGLSAASLLIELNERSGTRIEADRTLEQGKPVLLWGPIMRQHRWAHDFSTHPQVAFVDTVGEIIDAIQKADRLNDTR